MKNFLRLSEEKLKKLGGYHTAQEISDQPKLWMKTYSSLLKEKENISEFLEQCYCLEELEIILTGAGTSAYIGDVLEGPFKNNTKINTRAIATTDILTHPTYYLPDKNPLLLVSFARSGNSPESIAVVNLANRICQNIFHLIISCNPDGKLVKISVTKNTCLFLLPKEADDKSLAMTGSFTSMLLAGLLISDLKNISANRTIVEGLCVYANKYIEENLAEIENIASMSFNRAVFLGSGTLLGIARESHLKLQELTDGDVICVHDSFLGFRHGPKAVIKKNTLLVYLFSNNQYARLYEEDLFKSVCEGERGLADIGVGCPVSDANKFTLTIGASIEDLALPEAYFAIGAVLLAQLLGFFKSLNLGHKPDNPSDSGTITRVVKGVNVYLYPIETEAV